MATTLSILHKTPALLDPTRLKDDAGAEKKEPEGARCFGPLPQARAMRLRRFQYTTPRAIGDRDGRVARAAVGNDHLAHKAGNRPGNQRRQRRQECALAVVRADHHAEHEPMFPTRVLDPIPVLIALAA